MTQEADFEASKTDTFPSLLFLFRACSSRCEEFCFLSVALYFTLPPETLTFWNRKPK